jgi:general L-amino acid transport system permease protein
VVAGWAYRRHAIRQFERTGQAKSLFLAPLAIAIAGSLIAWVLGGAPTTWNRPILGEFAIENGGCADAGIPVGACWA